MTPNLAVAYAMKKRNTKKKISVGNPKIEESVKMSAGGMAKDGEMCTHGGAANCSVGCYAEGGAITDAPGYADHEDNPSMAGEEIEFNNENDEADDLDNEKDDPMGDIKEDTDQPMKKRLLTRVLNRIHRVNKGS